MTTLQTALQSAIPFTAKASTLPILEHVLIKDGRIVANNLTAEVEIAVDDDFDLDAAIPAGRIEPLIELLDNITIRSESGAIIVRHGKSRYRLPTLPADDYPRIAVEGEALATLTLDAGALSRCLSKALLAAAKGDFRYYLNGVLIEQANGELNIVATDGHRLIAQRLDARASGDFAAILPRDTVVKIAKWLGDGEVTLSAFSNIVALEMPGSRLLVKRIDGQFPNWRKTVPELPLAASIERDALLEALRRAESYINEDVCGIRVEIGDGEVAIEATGNADGSEAKIIVPAETIASASFVINLRYLEVAVKSAESERVGINCGSKEASSLRIEPEPRRDGYLHIVMPMRI